MKKMNAAKLLNNLVKTYVADDMFYLTCVHFGLESHDTNINGYTEPIYGRLRC